MTGTLSELPTGQLASVCDIRCALVEAQRLRELGLLEGRTLEVVRCGDPLICMVGSSRLGICGRLAGQIRIDAGEDTPR